MKILLVDDEREERAGIEWLIHKYNYPLEVTQANNGKTALDYIENNKIDILFTDVKMPIMNGLELAKEVCNRWPAVKIIIYSAYGEFEFARAAMEANAVSYLLKPIELDQFQKLMELVICSVQKEQQTKEEAIFNKLEGQKNLLFKVLSTGIIAEGEREKVKECLFDTRNVSYRLINIQFADNFFDKYESQFLENLKKNLSQNVKYLNIYPNEAYVVVNEENLNMQVKLKDIGKEILRYFKDRTLSSGVMIISDSFDDLEEMTKQVREIQKIQRDLFDYDNQPIFVSGYFSDKSYYESDAEKISRKLRDAIEAHEEVFIRKYNEQLIQIIGTMEKVSKLYLQNMLYSSIKCMYDHYQRIESNEILSDAEALFGSGNSKELLNIYKNAMDNIFLLIGDEKLDETRVIIKIKNLVEKEYSKDISLNDLADAVNLTPSYVSYIFNKETGQSLIKYITDVRMSKAKNMLEESNLKIVQIAKKCGYENQSYFNRLFKNYYGITPKQLREKL